MEISTTERHLIGAVDALEADIVDSTCRLVAQPSTLGNEASVLAVMAEELERLGLQPQRVPIDPARLASHPGFAPVPWDYDGRCNLVARRGADGNGGRSALFNGHLDVVSPEPLELWEREPFVPLVRDGWLYGRGAGDMKAGVAAMAHAVKAVTDAGLGLAAPVTIEAVIEEECSGNGALACLAAGHDADAVLIPEPFGPTILTHQLGVLWFKIAVRGVPSHVQAARAGKNAIEKSFDLIAALRRLEAEMNAGETPEKYRGIDHPINFNVGMIRGGDWPSTVPAEAEVRCRLSYFPGQQYADVRRQVERAVAEAAADDPWLAANPPRVEFYGFRSDGHGLPLDLPAFRTLDGCQRSLAGQAAEEYIATCTTDLRAFVHFGRGQGTCFGPLAENIHAANERVHLGSVMHTARAYALFLARWCGLVE